MSKARRVNLGCGPVFIDSPEWLNFDFTPSSPSVKKANLLGRLPLNHASVELVYSSHFLEHVPRSKILHFLAECYRVLKPGGVIRVVLPDLENIAREYLSMRDSGEHERANFVVLELVDQCVRRTSGGELGRFYRSLCGNEAVTSEMIDYVRQRVGEDLRASSVLNSGGGALLRKLQRLSKALRTRAERYYIRALVTLLPSAFREQNVSFAGVGERHQWVWDLHQLQQALLATGFAAVQRKTAYTSGAADFPFYPLDVDQDGLPRKGAESMYVEAKKPG